jgi:hypothetical protein
MQGILVVLHRLEFFGAVMHVRSETYAALVYGFFCILGLANVAGAQASVASNASPGTCAAMLSDGATGVRLTDSSTSTLSSSADSVASRSQSDTTSFGFGRGRNGGADIILRVGVHADEVRFAKQPNVRVRLCWGGDTLRVVQRQNLPSPVVAGTTYRNVYVEVELLGRLNAECLANVLGVGNAQADARSANTGVPQVSGVPASACAFLGGSAGAGAQSPRPPTP